MKYPEEPIKIKVLWLSPNFNHYKARFLNHLANDKLIELTILSGEGRINMGDLELDEQWDFEFNKVNVLKKDFGNSAKVRKEIKEVFKNFDWVMVPMEKKNVMLFLYTRILQRKHPHVQLFSYNHPVLRSGKGQSSFLDKLLTKWFFRKLDRVIFYTEKSWQWAIDNKMIDPKKAFWANNTIDTKEIEKNYRFQLPPKAPKILFIGRLIASKRIPELVLYYQRLANLIPNLSLDIIGDGPESNHLQPILDSGLKVNWHGTIVDEKRISSIMKESTVVFIPGHSGLSVNHAFCYGRPYITLQGPSHAPELGYLTHGKDGYVLDGEFEENVIKIQELISNRTTLEQFCINAFEKGSELSIDNWVKHMINGLVQ